VKKEILHLNLKSLEDSSKLADQYKKENDKNSSNLKLTSEEFEKFKNSVKLKEESYQQELTRLKEEGKKKGK